MLSKVSLDCRFETERQRKKNLTEMVISIEKGLSNMPGDFVTALYIKYCLHCALIEDKHILFIKC